MLSPARRYPAREKPRSVSLSSTSRSSVTPAPCTPLPLTPTHSLVAVVLALVQPHPHHLTHNWEGPTKTLKEAPLLFFSGVEVAKEEDGKTREGHHLAWELWTPQLSPGCLLYCWNYSADEILICFPEIPIREELEQSLPPPRTSSVLFSSFVAHLLTFFHDQITQLCFLHGNPKV